MIIDQNECYIWCICIETTYLITRDYQTIKMTVLATILKLSDGHVNYVL